MPRTITVVVDEDTNQVAYPEGYGLVRLFTSTTRAATVPAVATELGYETDTGIFYKATGTTAGAWSATAGGLRAVLSGDGSYVGFYDGATYKGKAALSAGDL